MLELKETKQKHIRKKINAVLMKNHEGDYHFYSGLTIILSGPLTPEDDGGFFYLANARRYDDGHETDFVNLFRTPEEAWEFYMNFQEMLEGSVWRRDYTNDCILNPDCIRFSLTGEKLP